MALLTVENLEKRFGGLIAVNDISFEVESGEIFTIIGPNGAGKSTLFKLITSFTRPTSGRVILRAKILPAYQHTWSLARASCELFRRPRYSKR